MAYCGVHIAFDVMKEFLIYDAELETKIKADSSICFFNKIR